MFSPNGIENALRQVMVADRVGNAQFFKCESGVVGNGRRDELTQKISTPIGEALIVSLQSGYCFPPVGIALLPAGHWALKETSNSHINVALLTANGYALGSNYTQGGDVSLTSFKVSFSISTTVRQRSVNLRWNPL